MKNVRVKVIRGCGGYWWDYAICEGNKILMKAYGSRQKYWRSCEAAIRNAKSMAKRIGIKYDPEIIKQHGC